MNLVKPILNNDGQPTLPIACIVKSTFNPRKHFDKSKITELSESIKRDGVIQAIVVRPKAECYEVVAGERRYRAAKLAGLESIPVTIKELDDEAAIRFATKENLERQNMSAIEESFAARTALTLVGGDRKAACATLSWTEQKLNKRLLLLNLCDAGQKALMKNKIHIGHAELLSSLSEENQENAITSIIEKDVTVEELKTKLAAFAYQLSTAIFNTDECNGCPNNSSTQFALFEESIGEGQCMNPICYEEKQASKLAYIKKAKEEDYNVVYLDTERTPESYNFIVEAKVGSEQYSQCKQCGYCGALISSRAETLGNAEEEVCFDTPCFTKKIKAIENLDATSNKENPSNKKKSLKKASSTKKKTADNKPPKKVLEYKTKLYKTMVSKELATDAHLMLVMNAVILLEALPSQNYGAELMKSLKKQFQLPEAANKGSLYDRNKTIQRLYALSKDELNELIAYATTVNAVAGDNSFDMSETDKSVESLVDILKPELAEHFLMDSQFLEANAKTGMVAVLKEAGFDVWYNTQQDKPEAFNKLANSTIKVIVETVEKSGFSLKGFVPKALYYKDYTNNLRGEATIDAQNAA